MKPKEIVSEILQALVLIGLFVGFFICIRVAYALIWNA